MDMKNATGWYTIEAWHGLDAVGFTTSTQRRGVVAHVNHYVADKGADRVIVTRVEPNGDRSPAAEVDATLTWKYLRDARLAEYLRQREIA